MIDNGVLVTGATGATAWTVAGWQAARQWKATTGRRATGMVTRVSRGGRGGDSCTVQFMDEAGVPRRFESNFRGSTGQAVRVGYPAGRPQHARAIGGLAPWGFPIMATLVGGAFLAVAVSLFIGAGLPRF